MRGDQCRHRGNRRVRQGGFSLLELAVVLVIISVLLGIIGTRFFDIQVYAEQAATEQVIGALQSALGMKVAKDFIKGGTQGLESLEGSNPMNLLAQVPKNYLGALRRPDPSGIDGGHWYFDTGTRVLVYQVRNGERLEGGARNPVRIRLAVRLQYEDRNRNGILDRGAEKVAGVELVPLEPYRWKR